MKIIFSEIEIRELIVKELEAREMLPALTGFEHVRLLDGDDNVHACVIAEFDPERKAI
jgi:hypothetical protein